MKECEQNSNLGKPVILIKDVLCAVSMMNIPVKDEDAQWLVGDALGVACRQRSGVKETEPTGFVFLCMVTWRTDYSHTISHLQHETNSSRSQI